ncbi:DMT family transporter [Pseudonocardia humida]|uniref:DMT family transporter n=1 Tax=Pseudonocardia humida TaxID=2800819 RepID=A0ABT1A0C6_9PSEU|nr:DMT family transporter [Pseudonocardia humida]MCO1656456.1 DMT family transporter [Pseudonocardia humida]
MSWLAAGLALVAAALLAVATVAQQRVAATVPDDSARGLGLLRVLVRRRLWWYGLLGDGGGYVAQAAALGVGSVLLVQPLLVTTLLFALPLAARWAGRRPGRAELGWAGALAVSLAVFVVVGNPTDGVDRAPAGDWLPLGSVLVALFAAALLAAARTRGTPRAVLLAGATALCYGAAAALTKGVLGEFDAGALAVLSSWELYVLVAVSVAGTLLQQSAFQAGGLGASLPVMTVGEPVVAVLIGTAVLGEQLRADGPEWVLIGLLVALMTLATVALARAAAPTGGQAAGRDGDSTPPTARGTSSSPTTGSARKPSAPA